MDAPVMKDFLAWPGLLKRIAHDTSISQTNLYLQRYAARLA
jgi:hypothetical protein